MRMLKRMMVVLVALVFVFGAVFTFAQGSDEKPFPVVESIARPTSMVGFSLPTFGTIHYDDEGNLKSVTGFNIGLGFSARHFLPADGLRANRFNAFWGWGTFLLIIPYVEFGVSYPFEIAQGTQYFVIDLGLLYITPFIQLSIYY